MADRRLRRQHSSISLQFDQLSAQYFCCFGICHARSIGAMIFFYELVMLIITAAILFLNSGSFTTDEWQSSNVLILVGVCLASLFIIALTAILFFIGVYLDKSYLIIPYILRQAIYVVGMVIAWIIYPDVRCLAGPMAVFQAVLLCLSIGTFRYFADLQKFSYNAPSLESSMAFNSSSMSISRKFSHKARTYQPKNRLLIGKARPATIDLC